MQKNPDALLHTHMHAPDEGTEWVRSVEQDISTCPGCGGDADNGFDRCVPPSPYYCTKCTEEGIPAPPVKPTAHTEVAMGSDREPRQHITETGGDGETIRRLRSEAKAANVALEEVANED